MKQLFAIASIALALVACSGAQVVQDVVVGLDAAVCVIQNYTSDISAGKTEQVAIEDAALKCGVSAAQALVVTDALHKAQLAADAGKE